MPDSSESRHQLYDITTPLKDAWRLAAHQSMPWRNSLTGEKVDARSSVSRRAASSSRRRWRYHLGDGLCTRAQTPQTAGASVPRSPTTFEYGQDTLEIHRDAVGDGHRVIIADDLLATGGTAAKRSVIWLRVWAALLWAWPSRSSLNSCRVVPGPKATTAVADQVSILKP